MTTARGCGRRFQLVRVRAIGVSGRGALHVYNPAWPAAAPFPQQLLPIHCNSSVLQEAPGCWVSLPCCSAVGRGAEAFLWPDCFGLDSMRLMYKWMERDLQVGNDS